MTGLGYRKFLTVHLKISENGDWRMGERQNLTRIFADKTIKTIFYTEGAEDTDKTKKLFFWLGPKKQKALFSFGQSPKCKPISGDTF